MRIATGNLRISWAPACVRPAAGVALLAAALVVCPRASAAPVAKLRISDASASESASALRFKVKISGRAEAPIRVTYTTVSGTAVQGSDFKAAKGQLSFQPGKREKAIVVKLIPDPEPEAHETLTVKLSQPDAVKIARARATGTIKDDDPPRNTELAAGGPGGGPAPVPPRIVINELMPDPLGAENDFEYVELLNTTAGPVDLAGWTIDSGSPCPLDGTIGPAAVYVVSMDTLIGDSTCGPSLANTGDTITLRAGPVTSGAVVDTVDYVGFPIGHGESTGLDPAKADPVENDDAANWCRALDASAPSYDPEGNHGTPGALNGTCKK